MDEENIQYTEGQKVRFKKEARVIDVVSTKEFMVPVGTQAVVVADQDVGEIGSIKLRLTGLEGQTDVVVQADDSNIEPIATTQ